jgi:hypothetical protein
MHAIQFFTQLILWFPPVAMHGHKYTYINWCEVWLQGGAYTCDFLQLVQFVKTKPSRYLYIYLLCYYFMINQNSVFIFFFNYEQMYNKSLVQS